MHPRERGGIFDTFHASTGWPGASPRARGNRIRPRRPLIRIGCIPASAGESPSADLPPSERGVHPRERGGIDWLLRRGLRRQGASPRARGNLLGTGWPVCWVGCIPASAGESHHASPAPPASRVHPRERGGIGHSGVSPSHAQGASPRARGNRVNTRLAPSTAGCIPASAGESPANDDSKSIDRVHPRERGGISAGVYHSLFPLGASPRARGNRPHRPAAVVWLGCIPASAGESCRGTGRDARRRVHPRERGGIRTNTTTMAPRRGASPRARGNPACGAHVGGHRGCIPASAGESSPRVAMPTARRVHPRERGGIVPGMAR